MATAADTALDVNNATDIQGTLVEERPAGTTGETDKGQAKHYQPLTALTIDGYKFTFTTGNGTDPAYYYSMSTAATQQQTIRLYGKKDDAGVATGNAMTITAPEGVTFGSIEFSGSNGKAGGVVSANVGSASMTSGTAMTWTNSEAVNTVTLTFGQSFRVTKMVVKSETGDPVDPVDPTTVKFTKVTTVENGTYVFVVNEDGVLKLARPYIGDKGYGRMNLTDATLDGEDVVTEEANAFELAVADGKVTIKNENRYYAMDDPSMNHFTSFQFYDTLSEGCYWTYEFVGDAVKLTNALNTECFISQTKGGQGTWYTNVAPAKAPTEYNLPMLYKKAGDSAVATIEADDVNAPVVYYNLQGQRVANPENGLYIRVQGNKVEKIAIR